MKQVYTTPELDVFTVRLSKDILGDSRIQETDAPILPDPTDGDPFGAFN